MPFESLEPPRRAELERIIRTQVKKSSVESSASQEGLAADAGEAELEAGENLLQLLGELPDDIGQEFLRTWLNSRLPLKAETVIPLLQQLQELSTSGARQRLITAAAFLQRQDLPLRQHFLRSLTALSESQEKSEIAEELISELPLFNPDSTSLPTAENLQKLPENLNLLFEQLFSFQNESGGEGESEGKNLSPNENRLLSGLLSLNILNLSEETGETGRMRLYLEWPPLNIQAERQLALRISSFFSGENKEKAETEDENFSISFIVELQNLGVIRADALLFDREIDLTFTAGSYETQEVIRENLPRLQEKLQELDYQIRSSSVSLDEKLDTFGLRNEIMQPETADTEAEKIEDLIKEYRHLDFRV